MAQWLNLLSLAVLAAACADGPLAERRAGRRDVQADQVDDGDNEDMVEGIDPRCGATAATQGCVIHRLRATHEVLDLLGGAVTGPVYFAVYAEAKVGMTGPGDHKPDYANEPTHVELRSPHDVAEIARGGINPGEYETLALVDVQGLVDPDNRVGPPGAPSTVPGPIFLIEAGYTTFTGLYLELLLP